jgi:hypothetical protein
MPVAKKDDPQALGSSITYARRYSLQAILMINVEEDDDGNKASGKTNSSKQPAPKTSLHSKHDKWKDAVRFYATQGKYAMTTIKQTFTLSQADEELLIEAAEAYNNQDGTDGSANN